MGEGLAFAISEHGVAGLNPTEGKIIPEPKRRFIAQAFHVHHSTVSKWLKYCW